jgi:hypothetical protein
MWLQLEKIRFGLTVNGYKPAGLTKNGQPRRRVNDNQ